jgi:hypothetical protein
MGFAVLDVDGDDGVVGGDAVAGGVFPVVVGVLVGRQEAFVPPFDVWGRWDEEGFVAGFFDFGFAGFHCDAFFHFFDSGLLFEGVCLGDEFAFLVEDELSGFAVAAFAGGECWVVDFFVESRVLLFLGSCEIWVYFYRLLLVSFCCAELRALL